MIKVKVATNNNRGFLKELFDYPFKNIQFDYNMQTVYEKPHKWRKILHRLIRMKIFDYLGVFQIIKMKKDMTQMHFSISGLKNLGYATKFR